MNVDVYRLSKLLSAEKTTEGAIAFVVNKLMMGRGELGNILIYDEPHNGACCPVVLFQLRAGKERISARLLNEAGCVGERETEAESPISFSAWLKTRESLKQINNMAIARQLLNGLKPILETLSHPELA